jgi:magnesium-protoporphyrin IX monomethyl ester (oxidative) cyclase
MGGFFVKLNSVFLVRVSSDVDKSVEHPQFFDPPYSLKYIEAGLKRYQNMPVYLLDCWIQPLNVFEILNYISTFDPELVVISASSFDIDISNELAAALKRQTDAPFVVAIGQGHYFNRDTLNSLWEIYDAILLGEPEEEFFTLFAGIYKNGTSDSSWKDYYKKCYIEGQRFLVEDPDSLPFPTYTSEELAKYRSIFPVQIPERVVWGYLIATRGCPHDCEFCSEVMRISIGKRLRSRSASSIADEMEHLARRGVNICSFQDDSFSANRSLVRSLCKELISRESKMKWMARVRVDELKYGLLALMKKAGCIMLGIGVESGSLRILKGMNKSRSPENWHQLCLKIFGWTKELKIGTNAYYVIGNPTETKEEIEKTINFALKLNADSIQVHFYTPYPGSAAWNKYKDQLTDQNPEKMYHYAAPLISFAAVSNEELLKLRSKFYLRYLLRPGFAIRHLMRYAVFYLHNPDIFRTLLGIRKVF